MTAPADQTFANSPWTMKPTGRSMFGKQCDSRKTTAPNYGLAASQDREQAAKVYLSPKHTAVERKCRESPGHIYKVRSSMDTPLESQKLASPSYSFSKVERLRPRTSDMPGPGVYRSISALGEQPLSPNRSPGRIKFGTSSREQYNKLYYNAGQVAQNKGTAGPPPGTYTPPSAVGPQVASTKPSSPSFTMSRIDRLKSKYEELSKTLPAVGQYDTWNSLGKQSLSLNKTMPSYGFGSSDRDKEANRYLSHGHAKVTNRCTASPAHFNSQTPGTTTSFGAQMSSRHSTTPAYGFGSVPKGTFKTSDTPGPGWYDN